MRYSSIQAFNGMEAPVILLTDIEDVEYAEGRALLCVGMTRAVERPTMPVTEDAKAAFMRALTGQ